MSGHKITVVGTGYVGMAMAVLLAQHNDVTALDIDPGRVSLINEGRSTVVDAEIELFGPGGVRTVGIGEWILNWYETCLNANELIKAIYLPPPAESYSSYRKVARVSGDYAVATCAISVEPHHHQVRIAIGGCGPAPLRDPDQEFALRDESLVDDELQNLVKNLITLADPIDDVRGSAEHRFRLIPRLARDAVTGLLEAHASSS